MLLTLLAVALGAEPSFELEGNELKTGPILYETGKPTLSPESNAALDHVKAYLDAKPFVTMLRVEVHSDSQGSDAFNQKLTGARAAVGFGESKPVAPNDTAEGRARNRRTVFVNAALRGKAIGGLPLDGGGMVAKVSVCL